MGWAQSGCPMNISWLVDGLGSIVWNISGSPVLEDFKFSVIPVNKFKTKPWLCWAPWLGR
jgi:hypothetical protein